jgi:signal transduction histidine kinase
LRIAVCDTGPPDGRVAAFGVPGQGLIGMRERAALYQGSVTAGPDPRGGWTVVTVLWKCTEPAESSVS